MKLSELIEKLSAYVMPEGDPEVDILIEHNNVQYEDSIGALTMSIQVKDKKIEEQFSRILLSIEATTEDCVLCFPYKFFPENVIRVEKLGYYVSECSWHTDICKIIS